MIQLTRWPTRHIEFDDKGLVLLLVTLETGTTRPQASITARSLLKKICVQLLDLNNTQLKLIEHEQGPYIANSTISISLSYANNMLLIGLSRHRRVGVDIVALDCFTEIDNLAHLYLIHPSKIIDAPPKLKGRYFAQAWSELEARGKSLGLPLCEMSPARAKILLTCELIECEQIPGYHIALARESCIPLH